eukprot:GFYU01010244.1.p1 GENE.GFYU01010244.1~~GFYU01010244.1.p1  ORF type:complete len:254 (-),score=54.13 GFYU01010244.1:128-889(-)
MKKIIFLDVDGVLCLAGVGLENGPVRNLKRIVDATGASIVLSSTWRMYPGAVKILHERFDQEGIPRCIDETPRRIKPSAHITEYSAQITNMRQNEITAYLREYKQRPNVGKFAWISLDDLPLTSGHKEGKKFVNHAITTRPSIGITEVDATNAIQLLNSPASVVDLSPRKVTTEKNFMAPIGGDRAATKPKIRSSRTSAVEFPSITTRRSVEKIPSQEKLTTYERKADKPMKPAGYSSSYQKARVLRPAVVVR